MKNRTIFFLFWMCLALIPKLAAAQEPPQSLLENADDLFVQKSFNQNFSDELDYINDFASPEIFHQFYVFEETANDVLISLNARDEDLYVKSSRLSFDEKRASDFHISYRIRRAESIPESGGSCWLSYTDAVAVRADTDSGVILVPGDAIYSYTNDNGILIYDKLEALSNISAEEWVKVDIIRLDGIAYFYLDNTFVFQYEDGFITPLSIRAGSMLRSGGNIVRCEFDDFSFISK